MKAVFQVPVVSKVEPGLTNEGSKASSDYGLNKPATLYALVRRIKRRVDELEITLNNLRRDVARVDRKQYRDLEKAPSAPQSEAAASPRPTQEQFWFG